MYRDKLTRPARIQIQRNIVSPVIIRSKPGKYMEVASLIRPFVERFESVFPTLVERFPRIVKPEVFPFTAYPIRVIPRFNLVAATLPREIIYRLAETEYVEKIYPDEVMRILQYPTVPPEGVFKAPHKVLREITFTSMYWIKKTVGADVANAKGFRGRGILACTIDTGASRVHEQLRGVEFETTIPFQHRDENGHGTWVTSCIGGVVAIDEYLSQRSGRRVLCEGIAQECGLLAVKSLGYVVGMGSTSNIIEGIDIAVERGASVINLSLGGACEVDRPEEDPYYHVFQEVNRYNIIPVVAAGNSGPDEGTVESPGAMPNVLTVGAYDPISGEIASFSSRGPTRWGDIKPDVVAPGVNIDSGTDGLCDTAGDGVPSRYSPLSGTSMATPVTSGLIVLMTQCHRATLGKILTLNEIKTMMRELGHEKSNIDGWGPITWHLYERWLETEYSVKI
jgi:hypothetical protein